MFAIPTIQLGDIVTINYKDKKWELESSNIH
jgi:hypothetical protein